MEHDILTFVNYDALAARNEGCFDVPWVQFLNDCLIYIYIYIHLESGDQPRFCHFGCHLKDS